MNDTWAQRQTEPEIAALVEEARALYHGTYTEVMVLGHQSQRKGWPDWQGPKLAVRLREIIEHDRAILEKCK